MNKTKDPQNYKNYLSYLYANAKHTSFAQRIKQIYLFFNKYILAGRILRYIRILVLWIQTGTYFVLFSTALLFVLPFFILSFLCFCICRYFMHKKYNSYFRKVLKNQSVCIIFNKKEEYINEYCNGCSLKIFVLTNPFTPFKSCVKQIGKTNYLISMSYFFSLKNNVLNKTNTKVIYEKEDVRF